MFSSPAVGSTSVPSISMTGLPSKSPRVLKIGPGPSDTNGTVTAASSTPKARIGTSATNNVRIRLFTPPRLDAAVHPERDRQAHDPLSR